MASVACWYACVAAVRVAVAAAADELVGVNGDVAADVECASRMQEELAFEILESLTSARTHEMRGLGEIAEIGLKGLAQA